MKIKRISKTKSAPKTKVKQTKSPYFKKHPVLQSPLHRGGVDKKSHIPRSSKTKPMTARERAKETEHLMKFYAKGLTIVNGIERTTLDRVLRAKTQLKIFFVKTKTKNIFKFMVKSSGLSLPEKYQVEIEWIDVQKMIKENATPEQIMKKSRIRTQCNCLDFKYRNRYLVTKANAVLGLKQFVYPKITNPDLVGICCKHQVLLFSKVQNPSFLKIFTRYIENEKIGRSTRIKEKDKISTHLSSGSSVMK